MTKERPEKPLDPQARKCLRSASLLAEAAGTARARELAGWYVGQLAANGMIPKEQLQENHLPTGLQLRVMRESYPQ